MRAKSFIIKSYKSYPGHFKNIGEVSVCPEEMEQDPQERAVEWDAVREEEGECVGCGKAAEERPDRFPTGFVFARNAARKFPTNPANPALRCNVPNAVR
jgi:hypothetical protein